MGKGHLVAKSLPILRFFVLPILTSFSFHQARLTVKVLNIANLSSLTRPSFHPSVFCMQ